MGIKVVFHDKEKELDSGISIMEALKGFDKKEAKKALGARINGKIIDLSTPLTEDVSFDIITAETTDGLEMIRHSAAHVMAAAVKRLFPNVQVTIGPSIESGFYYDFDTKDAFKPEDLPKIEKEMQKISNENHPFERQTLPVAEAIEIFKKAGENYKVEIIEDLVKDSGVETVSLYKSGDFTDLCRGPHVPSTSKIKAFKLLDVAGAYWRGDETKPMLQRIYGTAFDSKEELDLYLKNLEEAKKRDHRKLGKELDLFSFQEDGGPGLAYWHPNGALIRHLIETFWKNEHIKRGYQLVYTPHIARAHLWETSGHLNFYKENMYSPIDIEGQEYILKPMNCPFHILMYKTKIRSYRDLPMRWAELGTVYRYERSGVLHGLLRVRGFTQDDAHIFCTPEQLKDEMINCVQFARYLNESFGFKDYEIFLATRPPDFAGTSEEWDVAEKTLRDALTQEGVPFTVDEGGAVFYGPKIDIKLKDALGRFWQGPTIQFDFNLPRRFDVNFVGQDGQEHKCFMVHRAMLGSIERFFGCLIEHYGGAFPLWLSPVQAVVLPIADRHQEYAQKVADMLRAKDFRVNVDDRREKIGFKIREAQVQKTPYMIIVGDEEVASEKLSVRERKEGDQGSMDVYRFIDILKERIEKKI
jgi:threonyl-tRNA synthetase